MEAMLAGALAAEEASAAERPAPPRREGSMGMGSLVATAQAASALQRNATARAVDVDEQANVQLMEDVLERLKLLDYEQQFCFVMETQPDGTQIQRPHGVFKPLSRTYFAIAHSNPNEQFFYFTSLVSWLMSLPPMQHQWRAPSQQDDPNSAVAALYSQLQQIGAPTNFPATKLKLGHGEACCTVLHWLLAKIPLQFDQAVYPQEEEVEEAAVDDEAEVDVPEMADEVGVAECVEEEFYHGGGGAEVAREPTKLTDTILEANVAPEAWRIELERVTPQLKMQVLSDPKEWRNRCAPSRAPHPARARPTRRRARTGWSTQRATSRPSRPSRPRRPRRSSGSPRISTARSRHHPIATRLLPDDHPMTTR